MALADPQTVTVNGVAQIMPRVSVEPLRSLYQKDDESYKLTTSHQESGTRTRSMVRIDVRTIAADPLTAVNTYQTLGVYLVIDRPEYGFSATVVDQVVQGLKAWLTNANVTALFGGQH